MGQIFFIFFWNLPDKTQLYIHYKLLLKFYNWDIK